MTLDEAKSIVRGITDKIEATTDIDDWADFWGFTRDDYEEFLEMPIKLLEQEPCGDAISRQAVQDYIAKYLSQYLYNDVREAVEVIDEYIGELPSVTPQPKTGHWIPVSEKLPDKEGYYLCSVRYMYPPYNFFEPEKVKYMDDVTIQKFDGEFNIEVKAWMPLPPCYKPQESEE